jgi:hypothetical protein
MPVRFVYEASVWQNLLWSTSTVSVPRWGASLTRWRRGSVTESPLATTTIGVCRSSPRSSEIIQCQHQATAASILQSSFGTARIPSADFKIPWATLDEDRVGEVVAEKEGLDCIQLIGPWRHW